MASVSTAPPSSAVAFMQRSRAQSSAPHICAHSTPMPMVPPMTKAFATSTMGAATKAFATSTMGAATLMPASGRLPRNLPTTMASTML